jgi:hypothetical protein
MIAMTFARIGRSMKNFDTRRTRRALWARRGGCAGRGVGRDLAPGDRARDPVDDDPVGGGQALLDDEAIADLSAGFDACLGDDVRVVDREHVFALLVEAERGPRDREGSRRRTGRDADASEEAREHAGLGVREDAADLERSRRRCDAQGREVEVALVRIAVLLEEAEGRRDLLLGQGARVLGMRRPDPQQVALVDREVDVERIGLVDLREVRRLAGPPDEVAGVDEVSSHAAVERSRHARVAQVQLRDLDLRFGAEERRGRSVAVVLPAIDLGLRRGVLLDEAGVARELRRRVAEGRLLRGDLRLGLLELCLVLLGLDREEEVALLHLRAVREVHLLEIALDARDERDRVRRGGVAGELEVARDRLTHGLRDRHRRRRGRGRLRTLPARREPAREHEQACGSDRAGEPASTLFSHRRPRLPHAVRRRVDHALETLTIPVDGRAGSRPRDRAGRGPAA